MFATTTLADAPTMVRLPPRHAPSASDHHNGSAGSPVCAIRSTIGIAEAVYGMLSTIAEARAENHSMRDGGHATVAARRGRNLVADASHDAGLDDGLHEYEQPDEEEQRRPLDLPERLVGIDLADEHQDSGSEERNRRRLQAESRWSRKPAIVRPTTTSARCSSRPSRIARRSFERQHRLARLSPSTCSEPRNMTTQRYQEHDKDDEHDGAEVDQERAEVQPRRWSR